MNDIDTYIGGNVTSILPALVSKEMGISLPNNFLQLQLDYVRVRIEQLFENAKQLTEPYSEQTFAKAEAIHYFGEEVTRRIESLSGKMPGLPADNDNHKSPLTIKTDELSHLLCHVNQTIRDNLIRHEVAPVNELAMIAESAACNYFYNEADCDDLLALGKILRDPARPRHHTYVFDHVACDHDRLEIVTMPTSLILKHVGAKILSLAELR